MFKTFPRIAPQTRGLFGALYIWIAAIFFAAVYAQSLAFVYVEGDDAASVAYHALRRRAEVQPPYSPYHGLADAVLRFLPADELLLRTTAIAATAIAAFVFVALALALVFAWLGEQNAVKKTIFTTAILLAAPELFYFGLVYTPSVIAAVFVLAAHLLARPVFYRQNGQSNLANTLRLFFAALLFGAGTAFRWDIGLYGVTIAVDFAFAAFRAKREFNRRLLATAILWSIAAICGALMWIRISGYGFDAFAGVFALAQTEVAQDKSVFARVGAAQTLFTPAFLICFAVGIIYFWRRQRKLFLLVVAAILPVVPFLVSREPKMLLPALPAMFAAIVKGFDLLWFANGKRRALNRAALGLLLISPWLLGLQVETSDTTWGAGFDVHPYDESNIKDAGDSFLSDNVNKRQMNLRRVAVAFDGGFAVPTPEGARPLGGHAFVLLGGGWRGLMTKLEADRFAAIAQARALKIPLVQKDDTLFMTAHLLELGFTTDDAPRERLPNGLVKRTFVNADGERVEHYFLIAPVELFDEKTLRALGDAAAPASKIVLYSIHSPTRKRLYQIAPRAVETINSFSLVLDVEQLEQALKNDLKN